MNIRLAHTKRTNYEDTASRLVSLADAYEDQSGDTDAPDQEGTGNDDLVIPAELSDLSDDEVNSTYEQAVEAFNALYAASTDAPESVTEDALEQLSSLTDGIERLSAEQASRNEATADRLNAVGELAARVNGTAGEQTPDDAQMEDTTEPAGESGAGESFASDEDESAREVASGEGDGLVADGDVGADAKSPDVAPRPRETRVSLSSLPRRGVSPAPAPDASPSMADIVFSAGEGTGFSAGEGMDWEKLGKAVDRKLASHNATQYANAHRAGRHMREQHSIATIRRQFSPDLTVSSTDQAHVEQVMANAVDESRLPKGSLVASGGWCAPSETLYDMIELESRDGLLSLPEIGVARGGIQFTPGPSFADLYSQITGFAFTEQDDIDGAYEPGADGNVVGPKPCYHVDCPPFTDQRLQVAGLCITAGLLQSRGYPEAIARVIRGALIAHDHRVNGGMISEMVADSTAVTLPTVQVGATAPILTAVELQAEHYRYSHRLGRGATLEAIFPYWVRGAIRSDLSRRLGVDLLSVSNQQIDGWFRERGINPQYVYNWQAIDTTDAGSFTSWPGEATFLLYAAGTWVRGSSDIITLDTVYDSTLLSNNDYTALFTEEGWLVAKRGHDSRAVTVGITPDGATHEGVLIEGDGTETSVTP